MKIAREILGEILPAEVAASLSWAGAAICKIGYVRLELAGGSLGLDQEEASRLVRGFREELWSKFSSSPHVMEVLPSSPEEHDQSSLFRVGSGCLTLGTPIKLRVVIPARKRKELSSLSRSHDPEEFTIYFDGAHFLVASAAPSVPVHTGIGQVARELLYDMLGDSEVFSVVQGFGPTPIHPEIYVLGAEVASEGSAAELLPSIRQFGGNLFIALPGDMPIVDFVPELAKEAFRSVSAFYDARAQAEELDEAVGELKGLSSRLGASLAGYFSSSIMVRTFGRSIGSIRRTLASMHIKLNEIAEHQLASDKAQSRALKAILGSPFLALLEPYFREHVGSRNRLNVDAQTSLMGFAADETARFTSARATILAAFMGALVGGSLTLALQASPQNASEALPIPTADTSPRVQPPSNQACLDSSSQAYSYRLLLVWFV